MAIKLKSTGGNIDLVASVGQTIKGDDGGYYIPAVDADGNLTWTPSEEGMEPVISANIRGPQGIQGEQGPQGEPGADGTMTFEELTEEQKASLKGDKGDPGEPGESPFVISETEPTDTTKFWVVEEEEDANYIVFSDDIRKIIVVDEYPAIEELNVLYIKKIV